MQQSQTASIIRVMQGQWRLAIAAVLATAVATQQAATARCILLLFNVTINCCQQQLQKCSNNCPRQQHCDTVAVWELAVGSDRLAQRHESTDTGEMKISKQQSTRGNRYSHTLATESWRIGGDICSTCWFCIKQWRQRDFFLVRTTINRQ